LSSCGGAASADYALRAPVEHIGGCRRKPATEHATGKHEDGEEGRRVMLRLGES